MIPAAAANAAAIAAMRRISGRSDRELTGIGPAEFGCEGEALSGALLQAVVLLFQVVETPPPSNPQDESTAVLT